MKATIIPQPTPEPPPVTIQITASPLQFAVLAQILRRCVRWGDLPGEPRDWVDLHKVLALSVGDVALHMTANKVVDAAGGQYHP